MEPDVALEHEQCVAKRTGQIIWSAPTLLIMVPVVTAHSMHISWVAAGIATALMNVIYLVMMYAYDMTSPLVGAGLLVHRRLGGADIGCACSACVWHRGVLRRHHRGGKVTRDAWPQLLGEFRCHRTRPSHAARCREARAVCAEGPGSSASPGDSLPKRHALRVPRASESASWHHGRLTSPTYFPKPSHLADVALCGLSQGLLEGVRNDLEGHNNGTRGDLDVIWDSAKSMAQILNDVLDLGQLQRGHMALHCEPTDCVILIEQCISTLAGMATVPIQTHFDAALPRYIVVDPLRLSQVR